jgi:hypothetical protein
LLKKHPFQQRNDRPEGNGWEVQMGAISSAVQSELSKSSLPVKRQLVEKLAIDPANLKNDQFESARPRLGKRVRLSLAAIMFCIGVAATLAWQSRGDVARNAIASAFPQLGWLASQAAPVTQNTPDIFVPTASSTPSPDQQQFTAMPLDLDGMRLSVDQIAAGQGQMTRSVGQIAASQEQMAQMVNQFAAGQEQLTRTVGQLTASQEQLTREITKLQAIQQYILYKNSEAPAPKPVPRPTQARTAR